MSDITNPTTPVTLYCGENPAESDALTYTADGAKRRLDISGSVVVTNDESPTKYQLKADFDATGDSVGTGADVTLYTFTGKGILDFVAVNEANSSNYEIAVVIDGVERLRINMSQLGTDLGLISAGVPIWAETANKSFRYAPADLGFTTSFAILAKATVSGTRTLKHMVLFRERIV